MKSSILLSVFFFASITNAFSQEAKTFYMTINMNDKACTHIVDGLISPATVEIPGRQLAHFEQAASNEKLEKFGVAGSPCVMVRSSADLAIENYIYRQVHEEVQQIGIQYKIPIAVNGKLVHSFSERRSQLSRLREDQIKAVRFLDKAAAQAIYGDKVVFGLVEITM
ncbi:hypothetical protein [Pontibacter russatus]|uniref:hypothetical protein n=1 Tax=Pontibacter russatus TaxID=2694929 RepID=UPI00137A0180|nr:hypothetical protein [Pontibacter russatus]